MTIKTQLPYYALNPPSPLPTEEDVDSAATISQCAGQRVVKVGDEFIVKFGAQVSPVEGQNMIYVKETTSLSIPKVYAIYYGAGERCYIVMEYIPGETLASAWSCLNEAQKEAVCGILHRYLQELRAIPSPGYFGSIGRRPLLESMFWTPENDSSISGPFESEAELNEAMARKYVKFGASVHKAKFYRCVFPSVLHGHRAVFTHADFQRKNIIVDMRPDDVRVTLIDWEKSGWLPSYWEYGMAMLSDAFRDDWSEWLPKIMEPFYAEYPYLQMLHLDLWS